MTSSEQTEKLEEGKLGQELQERIEIRFKENGAPEKIN